MSNKTVAVILILVFTSCNSKKAQYEKLHEKYRTFWYRTGERCYYDSCKKYGELWDKERGISKASTNYLDTVAINEPAINCK